MEMLREGHAFKGSAGLARVELWPVNQLAVEVYAEAHGLDESVASVLDRRGVQGALRESTERKILAIAGTGAAYDRRKMREMSSKSDEPRRRT